MDRKGEETPLGKIKEWKKKGEGREGPPVAVTETLCPVIPFPSSPLPLFPSFLFPLLPSAFSVPSRPPFHTLFIPIASLPTPLAFTAKHPSGRPFAAHLKFGIIHLCPLPLAPYFLVHPTRPSTRSTSCWILPSTRLSPLSAYSCFSAGTRHEGDPIQIEGERGREGGILLSGGVRLESGGKNGSERGRHHVRRRGTPCKEKGEGVEGKWGRWREGVDGRGGGSGTGGDLHAGIITHTNPTRPVALCFTDPWWHIAHSKE